MLQFCAVMKRNVDFHIRTALVLGLPRLMHITPVDVEESQEWGDDVRCVRKYIHERARVFKIPQSFYHDPFHWVILFFQAIK